MTKYDIRLRRKSLTSGQIGRHKDFRSLYKTETNVSSSERRSKLIVIVAALVIIIGMIIFGVMRIISQESSIKQVEPTEDIFDEFKQD